MSIVESESVSIIVPTESESLAEIFDPSKKPTFPKVIANQSSDLVRDGLFYNDGTPVSVNVFLVAALLSLIQIYLYGRVCTIKYSVTGSPDWIEGQTRFQVHLWGLKSSLSRKDLLRDQQESIHSTVVC